MMWFITGLKSMEDVIFYGILQAKTLSEPHHSSLTFFLIFKWSCVQFYWLDTSSLFSMLFLILVPQHLLLCRVTYAPEKLFSFRVPKKMCHVSVAMAVVWVPTNHFSHTNFKMVTKFETLWFLPRKHRTSAVSPIMSAGTHLPLWACGWPPGSHDWYPSTGWRADPVSPWSCHGNLHGHVCHFAWRNLHFLAMEKQELNASWVEWQCKVGEQLSPLAQVLILNKTHVMG